MDVKKLLQLIDGLKKLSFAIPLIVLLIGVAVKGEIVPQKCDGPGGDPIDDDPVPD